MNEEEDCPECGGSGTNGFIEMACGCCIEFIVCETCDGSGVVEELDTEMEA